MYTAKPALCARAGNSCPRTHSCTTYARDAVLAEFRPRDARAIDHNGFRDRRPDQAPRLLGQVAATGSHDTGTRWRRLDDVEADVIARLNANQHDRTAAAMSGVAGTQVPSPAAPNRVAFS